MASSSPTHPNYSPLFINPPSPVKELELAKLWAQMDKYIANGYQDTSSDEEDEELAIDEKRPTAAEEGGQLPRRSCRSPPRRRGRGLSRR